MLRQVIKKIEKSDLMENKKFEEFQGDLKKYTTISAKEDYANLTSEYAWPFDMKQARLSVAYYVYGADINLDIYKDITRMSQDELLKAILDHISDTDGADESDYDFDEDSLANDD